MKKILIVVFLLSLSIASVFGYSSTVKDDILLGGIYNKLDLIGKSKPSSLESLYIKFEEFKEKVHGNERVLYLLDSLKEYSLNILLKNENINYKVIKVIDGDTVKIEYLGNKYNIRLIGIDSPESYLTRFGYKECYGDEAKEYLKNLLEGKNIQIEFDASQGKTDRYNRMLGYIIYNGENINNKLIAEGYAWEYTYNKDYRYISLFKESESIANNNKEGLWSLNTCNGKRLEAEEYINVEELNNKYSCGTKVYCTEMNSCEEAIYFLNVCGLNRLDADSDGIPCESICK